MVERSVAWLWCDIWVFLARCSVYKDADSDIESAETIDNTERFHQISSGYEPGKQLKYADQYEIPLAILFGSKEKEQNIVTVKNMAVGRAKAGELGDRSEWIAQRPGQTTIPRAELVDGIRKLLAETE